MAEPERTTEETRELILDTAEGHLRRYGYAKTTVVEIARGCGMSHANVYRFFESKAAIIDAVIRRWLEGTETSLRQITKQAVTATDQLEAFVVELHRIKRAQLNTDKEVFETYSIILQEHRSVVEQHIEVLLSLLQNILESGVQSKEFQISDLHQATLVVWDATLKFHHPLLLAEAIAQPTESQARTMVKVLIVALTSGCP
jgi:AcrR family transcriptional regulator